MHTYLPVFHDEIVKCFLLQKLMMEENLKEYLQQGS